MDEEMEEGTVEVYDVVEVDFDYEFDAARFFNFSRPETGDEAHRSESWFQIAPSYPPSPFVAKLFPTDDLYSEFVDASPKSKYYNSASLNDGDIGIAHETECCNQEDYQDSVKINQVPSVRNQTEGLFGDSSGALLFYNHLADDMKKIKGKFLTKPSLPRSSTLMKPTASQLAKQNQRRQVCGSRLQNSKGSSNAQSGIESQASKRQKLDGGLLRKIVDVKQPLNLIHKAPKKESAVHGMISRTKPRITIPREPELETAHRAERIRFTGIKKAENRTAFIGRFKPQPFNKKILEAPVLLLPKKNSQNIPDLQTLQLKTTDRTKHLESTVTSTSVFQADKGFDKTNRNCALDTGKDDKRCDAVNAPKGMACQPAHSFKARPLDRKILTSRGDLGIFRNSKREVTVPKEFQFQTAKRNQQNPPIEAFSKLSLASDPQPKNVALHEMSHRTSIFLKTSKENRWEEPCRQNQHIINQAKQKAITYGRQTLSVATRGIGEMGSRFSLKPFGNWRQQ